MVLAETPEIYGAEHLLARRAVSREVAAKLAEADKNKDGKDKGGKGKTKKNQAQVRIAEAKPGNSLHLAQQLEKLTGLESRLTILGYMQRGGTP